MTLATHDVLDLHIAAPLARERGQRAAQRRGLRATRDEALDGPGQRVRSLSRKSRLSVIVTASPPARTPPAGCRAGARPRPRASARRAARTRSRARARGRGRRDGSPTAGAPGRATRRDVDGVGEVVDPGRPALRVVPQRLGLGGQPGHHDRRGGPAISRRASSRSRARLPLRPRLRSAGGPVAVLPAEPDRLEEQDRKRRVRRALPGPWRAAWPPASSIRRRSASSLSEAFAACCQPFASSRRLRAAELRLGAVEAAGRRRRRARTRRSSAARRRPPPASPPAARPPSRRPRPAGRSTAR